MILAIMLSACKSDFVTSGDLDEGLNEVTFSINMEGLIADTMIENDALLNDIAGLVEERSGSAVYTQNVDGVIKISTANPVPVAIVTQMSDLTGIAILLKDGDKVLVSMVTPETLLQEILAGSGDDASLVDTVLQTTFIVVDLEGNGQLSLVEGDPADVSISGSHTVLRRALTKVTPGNYAFTYDSGTDSNTLTLMLLATTAALVVGGFVLWRKRTR